MDIRDVRAIGTKRVATTGRQPGDPTPEEIKEACVALQAEWSPSERLRRSHPVRPVDMTVVHRVVDDGE